MVKCRSLPAEVRLPNFLGAGSASHQRPCQVVAKHVLELERTLNQRVGIRRLSRQGGAPPCLAKELLCLKALCHNLGLVEALLTTTRSAFFLVFLASLFDGVELERRQSQVSLGPSRTCPLGRASAVTWRAGLPRPNERGFSGERKPRLLPARVFAVWRWREAGFRQAADGQCC